METKLVNGPRFALLIGLLCLFAYLPAFNNGFISDDYVILGRLDSLRHNPFVLFSEPPECFRLTSYFCFEMLRLIFGYNAAGFYSFTLLLHIANSLLVWKLVSRLSNSVPTGMLTALIFATEQGHQEAVMWLAAMNETLLTFFLLLCLLLWAKDWAVHGAVPYAAALFSKESALMLIGILPWLQWSIDFGKRHRRTAYSLVILISAAFIALFLSLASNNFMLNTGTYAFGVHGIPVFLVSMHRMLFPYVYLALMILLAQWRTLKIVGPVSNGLGFASIAILPYIFLTYQNHITSRQEYMASIGIAWLLATLILGFKTRAWQTVFVVVFITANIGYLWVRKDAQFEGRAAPTNRLIEVLQNNPPQNLYLDGFQENPWIAKETSRMVNGWKPELIHVNETPTPPVGALQFSWDSVAREYKSGNKP